MKHTQWYKNAIIYQIYPRSFCDSNSDGFGDINGIISKLDYLKELGINCVWLSPVYDSPQYDNGYDIADYYNIYSKFGTMQDFERMVEEMHKRGIKLIMDLVVNHTSFEHKWFRDVLNNPDSKYKDYYIIKQGKDNKPPTNWTGFFGGSTWEKLPYNNEYYLHLFAKEQPDLNWENPKVREEVVNILRYWMDKGVDGFRCDVITLISKKQDFKNRLPSFALCGKDAFVNGPRLHEFLHELYEKAYKDYDSITVGETVLSKLNDIKLLTSPEREELDMVFNFDHTDSDNYFGIKYLYRKFKLNRFKKRLAFYQYKMYNCGWNSLFIENHDQRRSIGRFGTDDGVYKLESSKMLATTYFLLQGTPFIYQGQEFGMENADFTTIDEFQDVEIHNMYKMTQQSWIYKILIGKHLFDTSRDNSRTPMQWDDSEFAGFSNVNPWMRVNKNKNRVNAKLAITDNNSLMNYYKKLIEFRKTHQVVIDGKFELLEKHNKNVFAYTRTNNSSKLLIISSFSKENIKNPIKNLDGYRLLLSNYEDNENKILKSYETRVYIKDLK